MSHPKQNQQNFTSDNPGERPVAIDANKGKKMATKTAKQPDVIQTKGE